VGREAGYFLQLDFKSQGGKKHTAYSQNTFLISIIEQKNKEVNDFSLLNV
jgi:hypothetical protein